MKKPCGARHRLQYASTGSACTLIDEDAQELQRVDELLCITACYSKTDFEL
jgi:hypothetical protein